MRLSRATAISGALVWATTGLAIWAWFVLPSGAGVPYNSLGLDGQRHVGVSREALWLIPFAAPLVWTCLTFAPRFLGRRVEDLAPELYDAILVAVSGLLLVVEATLVAAAFDAAFNVMRPVAVGTGALLLAVGNYMGKARQNELVGLTIAACTALPLLAGAAWSWRLSRQT